MQIGAEALLQGPQGMLWPAHTESPQPPGAPCRSQEGQRGDKAELPTEKKKSPVCWFSEGRKIEVNAAT